jgi:hypothetical protein
MWNQGTDVRKFARRPGFVQMFWPRHLFASLKGHVFSAFVHVQSKNTRIRNEKSSLMLSGNRFMREWFLKGGWFAESEIRIRQGWSFDLFQ